MFHAIFAMLHVLGAHHAHRPPAAPPHVLGTRQALSALLRMVHAHHGHVVRTGTYGYGAHGAHTARNGGVYVDLGHGQCVGYETYGHPGYFGNTYGLTGGDCG